MLRVLMICGEDIIVPIGGRGVYLKLVCEKLIDNADVTVLTPTASGCDSGFFHCDEDGEICVQRENWTFKEGYYRLFKAHFFNDYPVLPDKNLVELKASCEYCGKQVKKQMLVEGHGKIIFEEFKAYHNFVLNFCQFMRNMAFDLIHVHDTDLWFVAQALSLYYKCPVIVGAHLSNNLGPDKFYQSPHWRLTINRESLAYEDCASIHTLSNYYAREITALFPNLKDKITVIPNGINHEELADIEFDAEERTRRLEGRYEKIITLVGRLVPQKGIDFFIEAVKQFPNYKFILISVYSFTHDKGLNEIAKLVEDAKQRYSNFDWESHCSQELKWKLMKLSDIGVVPSRYGSYEIVVAEWLSLGIPSIISNCCPIIEYLPENCCDIIEPSSESLINAIKNFKHDSTKIGNGIKFAEQNTWDNVATKHISLYNIVVKQG